MDLLRKEIINDDLADIIKELRVLCANEKSSDVLEIVNMALKHKQFSSKMKYQVDLYELKIKQLFASSSRILQSQTFFGNPLSTQELSKASSFH